MTTKFIVAILLSVPAWACQANLTKAIRSSGVLAIPIESRESCSSGEWLIIGSEAKAEAVKVIEVKNGTVTAHVFGKHERGSRVISADSIKEELKAWGKAHPIRCCL